MLRWNPWDRISPKKALVHDWILKGLPTEVRKIHVQQTESFQ